MKHIILLYSILILIFSISACSSNKKKEMSPEEIARIQQKSIEVNRQVVKALQDTIALFAKKNNWNMQKTGTGLWYSIRRSGAADTIRKDDIVEYGYTVSLLNGTVCYSSDSSGVKRIKVGQGGVESGVEEALRLMCAGDSARLLIPPHLAHGLIGDQVCIPKLAILNYTLVVHKRIAKQY
ncbi:MAG TPA: FKBP-type peptidyl-prolyl cis-trans isomerase [Bacteroidales bacterium]|nr:MAG: putative FKBP-type peptidyl-prolyl cis-trans isomerase [Bacteroidetes bacterium ADurb.Bin217]HPM11995.1 FKBP-type peptidyl-prolyl cis-trans isomerase [Bacteroidales bacterium]